MSNAVDVTAGDQVMGPSLRVVSSPVTFDLDDARSRAEFLDLAGIRS